MEKSSDQTHSFPIKETSVQDCHESLLEVFTNLESFTNALKEENYESIQKATHSIESSILSLKEHLIQLDYKQHLMATYLATNSQYVKTQKQYISTIENVSAFVHKLKAKCKYFETRIVPFLSGTNEEKIEEKISLPDFISIASNITATANAPLNYKTGDRLAWYRPPVPTEDMIRRSLLYQQEDLLAKKSNPPILESEINVPDEFLQRNISEVDLMDVTGSESALTNVPKLGSIDAFAEEDEMVCVDLNP